MRGENALGGDHAGQIVRSRLPTHEHGLLALLGCGNCFKYFRGELAQTVDKFQNGILSSPEKRQRELSIILLEDEYFALIERRNRRPNELGAISARLKEIERQLAELGVRVDE